MFISCVATRKPWYADMAAYDSKTNLYFQPDQMVFSIKAS